jgi:Protein of unknown function (DUF2934)
MPAGSARLQLSPVPRSSELQDAIRKRAEEIYVRNGRNPGRDLDNWTQAEAEIAREYGSSTRRTAVVVDVDGVQYVGEYGSESCDGYQPGEFNAGGDISIRFAGDKMLLKRPNGKELETTIVHKIG